MKKLLLLITSILFLFNVQAQDVSAKLSKKKIQLGEQCFLDWTVQTAASSKNFLLPNFQDTLSKSVEIVAKGKIDTTFEKSNSLDRIFTQQLTITAWDSGFQIIPPITFIIDGKEYKTEPLMLEVVGVQIEADADIKDIKTIIEVPFSLWDWILSNKKMVGLSLLCIALLVIGFFLYRKYKNRPIQEKEIFVPKEAADSLALRKLEELKAKKLWQHNQTKGFYVSLSYILREYISNRYQLNALERTTDEIMLLTGMQLQWTEELKRELHQTLLLADMAKFARQNPLADENEKALKNAYAIIQKTAYVEAEKKDEEIDNTKAES